MIHIARRENNNKRGYLLVNSIQGKHIPARPKLVLAEFERLAQEIARKFKGERLLAIGFAETATAIGAAVAAGLSCPYLQTTREEVGGAQYLFFSEEHSHAAEQRIVRDELDNRISQIDRIVFVEDELTTGKTILNGIQAIEKAYGKGVRFGAACILNGMDGENQARFHEKKVDYCYLHRIDHRGYEEIAKRFAGDGQYIAPREGEAWRFHECRGKLDPRQMVHGDEYAKACQELAKEVLRLCSFRQGERVLLLGTEECMFPAIYTGAVVEDAAGAQVWTHSTTRSPILTSNDEGYPLQARFELESLYAPNRKTFLYNLAQYQKAVVITDAEPVNQQGAEDLAGALAYGGNRENYLIQWRRP